MGLGLGDGGKGQQEVSFDCTDAAFASDHFRMYEFKIKRCPRARPHDWTQCPFAHPGEKAKRRDPRRFRYSGTACPDFRKTGACIRGDACPYAHGVFECWLHPGRYRTQLCTDGANCRRRVCFFAHFESEIRTPDELQAAPGAQAQLELAAEAQAMQQQQQLAQALGLLRHGSGIPAHMGSAAPADLQALHRLQMPSSAAAMLAGGDGSAPTTPTALAAALGAASLADPSAMLLLQALQQRHQQAAAGFGSPTHRGEPGGELGSSVGRGSVDPGLLLGIHGMAFGTPAAGGSLLRQRSDAAALSSALRGEQLPGGSGLVSQRRSIDNGMLARTLASLGGQQVLAALGEQHAQNEQHDHSGEERYRHLAATFQPASPPLSGSLPRGGSLARGDVPPPGPVGSPLGKRMGGVSFKGVRPSTCGSSDSLSGRPTDEGSCCTASSDERDAFTRVMSFDNILADLPRSASQVQLNSA